MPLFGKLVITNFCAKIAYIKNLKSAKGCKESQILAAEKQLDMRFPTEYRDYLRVYGQVSFGNTIWTGLGKDVNDNVVTLTLKERISKWFPMDSFVLEKKPDGTRIVVNNKGLVYLFKANELVKIQDNLEGYLDICIRQNLSA